MQHCEKCNHKFGYLKMFTAVRNVTCPSCQTKYKVEAKNVIILIALIVIGVVSISSLEELLPRNIAWVSYVIVIGIVFILAPFNQRIEKIE